VTFATAALGGPGPGPGLPGIGPGPALTVAGLSLSPSRFRRGAREATITRASGRPKAKTLPTSTTISFGLSQPATVTLSFQAALPGVLVRGKCTAPPKGRRKGRPCTRYVAVPGAVRRAAHTGTNRIRFQGALDSRRKLALGSYRLSLTASTAAAAATAAQRPGFTLLP
jgi:hypothetical protein